MDAAEHELLVDTLRRTMTDPSGPDLDTALAELGWPDLLAESPDIAISTVFRLLGETGAHAPLLNDVVSHEAGRAIGGTLPLPFAGDIWVVWRRTGQASAALDPELPLISAPDGAPVPLAAGRRALGWWLVGTGRAMLSLARAHAVARVQFSRPIATFQAVRHRLAETLVAIEGAAATLIAAQEGTAEDRELGALLAKAAAGRAALTAARHCQQVLGGIGFTVEHEFHRHARRALVLDGLLGSARELACQAGALLRERGSAPRLAHL